MDPGMNQLLKWSIENADASRNDPTASTDPKAERPSGRPINADALNALLGGPTDADMMRESMAAIQSPDVSLENKLVAFDNFEQLIENLDNANNMEPLGLWTPLVGLLNNEEPDVRRMAAWCVGTAVQNNVRAQERCMVVGAIPSLVRLAVGDTNESVRRKAIYALSSEIRNFQPGLNEALKNLPDSGGPSENIDAGDMGLIDNMMEDLREKSKQKA